MKDTNQEQSEMKLLGGLVPLDVYWKFKKAAANRKEGMKEAILNAALLYIGVTNDEEIDK